MADRKWFVGQTDPAGDTDGPAYEITNEPIKISKTEILNMRPSDYKEKLRDPKFAAAVDAAFAPQPAAPTPAETPGA